MSENSLFKVTALIWSAYTIVMITLLTSAASISFGVVIIAVILSVAAAGATSSIWQSMAKTVEDDRKQEKAKRDEFSRIERLTRLMNEDDIVELESVLKQRELDALRTDNSA